MSSFAPSPLAEPVVAADAPENSPRGAPLAAFDATALQLPGDADAPAFAERLQVLRAQFEDRSSYNFMVCDELARRGIQPNSHSVLKVGRWGSSNAVAADVRTWYARLSQRLQAQHAGIPDAARQSANRLLEQLWALSVELSAEPLGQKIRALDAELAAEQAAHTQAQAQIATLVAEHTTAQAHNTALQAQIDRLGLALASETERLNAAQVQYLQETEKLQRNLAETALAHNAALRGAAEELGHARQDFEAQMHAQRQAFNTQVGALQAHLTALQAQADKDRREAALQMDRARQDVREAHARADQAEQRAHAARALEHSLREQLAHAGIELAKAQMVLQTEKESQVQQKQRVDHLEQQLAQQAQAWLHVQTWGTNLPAPSSEDPAPPTPSLNTAP
ncbi:MAG: DNA-binding protein [Burkholderiaceae bacterium]|nr:DNA-binding protein [Burkholderiaceae bacterium]